MMAARRKPTPRPEKQHKAKETGLCQDCKHSGNRIEKDINGEFFMCWCPFHRWAKFLRHDTCEHFENNEDGKETKDN